MTAAEIKAAGTDLARRTRNAQGLSPTIRDRDAVRRVVALLVTRRGAPP
jgi:hypothetical protein